MHHLVTLALVLLLWSEQGPAQGTWIFSSATPPLRNGHEMAYDSARGRTVLFGGLGLSLQDETWEWDGTTWSQRTPAVAPSPRMFFGVAYDPVRGRTVVFGGNQRTLTPLGDTWEWDGTSWTLLRPVTSPPAREGHSMVFDRATGKVLLFGGQSPKGGLTFYSDTWTWDGINWTQLTPTNGPGARSHFAMAASGNQVLLQGGANLSVYSDTWTWDGRSWRQVQARNLQVSRYSHNMTFDSVRGSFVMFGGTGVLDWFEWTGATWDRLRFDITTLPSRRTQSGLVHDTRRDRLVLWGGTPNLGPAGTWELRKPLTVDLTEIAAARGGVQTLTIDAGVAFANQMYWVFGSISGTRPGTLIGLARVPLNTDPYTVLTHSLANGPTFAGFRGTLDGQGRATARITVPAVPGIDLVAHHACVISWPIFSSFTSTNPATLVVR